MNRDCFLSFLQGVIMVKGKKQSNSKTLFAYL